MTTNETLIEEKIDELLDLKGIEFLNSFVKGRFKQELVKVYKSALQAKEDEMVKKMLKEIAEMPVVLVDVRFNSTDKPKYAHALLYEELKSKLSNLSEKK